MTERPGKRDDDEAAVPPEVTVPPWLRTGPDPGPDVPSEPDRPRPVPSAPAEPDHDSAPSRITLGARGPASGPARDPHETRPGDDDLSTLPLRPGAGSGPAAGGTAAAPGDATPASAGPARSRPGGSGSGRGTRIAVLAAAGVAVVAGSAVLGYVLTRGAMAPAEHAPGTCAAVEEPGHVRGDGPGSLDTPAGAVLAFDHAYYVDRSAEKAFEAVAGSSRMSSERLQADGIDALPEGTTHCVDVRELSATLLEVTLTEARPDAEPVDIRQRVRVERAPDGTWGIVSITPAG